MRTWACIITKAALLARLANVVCALYEKWRIVFNLANKKASSNFELAF